MRCSITLVLWWRPLISHSPLLVRVHIYLPTPFSCQVEFLWVSSAGE